MLVSPGFWWFFYVSFSFLHRNDWIYTGLALCGFSWFIPRSSCVQQACIFTFLTDELYTRRFSLKVYIVGEKQASTITQSLGSLLPHCLPCWIMDNYFDHFVLKRLLASDFLKILADISLSPHSYPECLSLWDLTLWFKAQFLDKKSWGSIMNRNAADNLSIHPPIWKPSLQSMFQAENVQNLS